MKTVMVQVTAAVAVVMGGSALLWATAERSKDLAPAASEHGAAMPLPQIHFSELLEQGAKLKPTAKALGLNGKRVRMVGYMAEMELPPTGAFYLVPRPLKLDEAGGGTADLPLESVLVTSPALEGKIWAYVAGPLEGTGILEVGNQSDAQGRISNFRLKLEPEATADIYRTALN